MTRRGQPIRGRPSPRPVTPTVALREAYAAHPGGATGWYAAFGASYQNPHEAGVIAAVQALAAGGLPEGRLLDLACGSGELSRGLVAAGASWDRIDAVDPFTAQAYSARTGRVARALDFAQIARGALAEERWDLIGCSFALHLCPDELLPAVCLALSRVGAALWLLSPHKRPELRATWGWELVEERYNAETRVRARRYQRAGLRTGPPPQRS